MYEILNTHFNAIMISITATMLMMLAYVISEADSINYQKTNPQNSFSAYHGGKLPELNYFDHYDQLRSTSNTVVVYPIFTQSAYALKGIHDFNMGYCDSCITAKINDFYKKTIASSGNGYRILEFLDYEIIDDIDIDKNPNILNQFDRVILLHNEFVTRAEFNAITQHPDVVYLYPNALSSEIQVDYSDNTITLLRGPGYPEPSIVNGFDWKFDNTNYFLDWECNNWEFYEIENGHMLNCYPETLLPKSGHEILQTLKTL